MDRIATGILARGSLELVPPRSRVAFHPGPLRSAWTEGRPAPLGGKGAGTQCRIGGEPRPDITSSNFSLSVITLRRVVNSFPCAV